MLRCFSLVHATLRKPNHFCIGGSDRIWHVLNFSDKVFCWISDENNFWEVKPWDPQAENCTEIRSLSPWTETHSLHSHTGHYPFCAKNKRGTVWDNKKTSAPLRKPKTQQMTCSGGLLGVQLCAFIESLQLTRNELKCWKGRGNRSFDPLDNFARAQIKPSNQELFYSKPLQLRRHPASAPSSRNHRVRELQILQKSYQLPEAERAHGHHTPHLMSNAL